MRLLEQLEELRAEKARLLALKIQDSIMKE
jgi:hypothetical protein